MLPAMPYPRFYFIHHLIPEDPHAASGTKIHPTLTSRYIRENVDIQELVIIGLAQPKCTVPRYRKRIP
jgi:hypothetical protein